MRPRTLAFAALVALQALVLVGGAVAEEWRLARGDDVVLRTMPVDPRDLFRGDYVVLAYEISEFHAQGVEPGDVVFVELAERDGIWRAVRLHRRPPESGATFIRGEVRRPGWIEYGIEAYFVPEGRGWEIESGRNVDVAVSIDRAGRARIRYLIVDGRRWR